MLAAVVLGMTNGGSMPEFFGSPGKVHYPFLL